MASTPRQLGLVAAVVAAVLAAAWWLKSPPASPEDRPVAKHRPDSDRSKPRFTRTGPSATRVAPPSEVTETVERSFRLAYPDGVLLSCPAPEVADGRHRVIGSTLAHLWVSDGYLTGVLPAPGSGAGLLSTLRGHPVAELAWSESGCEVAPLEMLSLEGSVVDAEGEPVAGVEVRACVGELTQTDETGAFTMNILAGQTCSVFAFREDEQGFAKGKMVEVVGGETERVDLGPPGEPVSAAHQQAQLQQFAEFMMAQLDKEHDRGSAVTSALEAHGGNPVLQVWAQEELDWLNLRYEDAEFLMSGDVTDEDWREAWLFGVGM